MYQRLFIGNKIVNLIKVDSTNAYLKQLLDDGKNEPEGIVIVAKDQFAGRGQKGEIWKSEVEKNLTFSFFLKPNLLIKNQFLISKVISLGIIDFLNDLGLKGLKIKWPNDIYCGGSKISGILIENTIKGNKIYNSIVGIGLHVNQTNFNLENNPTSIIKELGGHLLNLKELLNQLLFFIERRYMLLKSNNEVLINENYLEHLFWINETQKFKINNNIIDGIIIGVNEIGKLQVRINAEIEEFDLKEIEFI